jgi:hypothetical protein
MSKLKIRVNNAWAWPGGDLTELPSVPGVMLQPIDGGPAFYANSGFSVSAPVLDDPNFFPIAVWFESVTQQSDIDKDKDTGLNMYIALTTGSDMAMVRNNGMYAIVERPDMHPGFGAETLGWLIADETDLFYAPGWGAGQGYAFQQSKVDALPQGDGRFFYANYTVGVILPTFGTVESSMVYINNFQHTVSNDFYWWTGHNIYLPAGSAPWNQASQFYRIYDHDLTQTQARRSSHYGSTVGYMRKRLQDPNRWEPTWGFIENGGPFPENVLSEYMTPEVMVSAVWHMIIQGARGIIYFNHTFGVDNQSQHNFRMPQYAALQAAAKVVNGRVQGLAAVINDNFALNFVTVSPGASTLSGIEVMAKYHTSKFYIFAGSRENDSTLQNATFTIPNGVGTTATVLFESRTIPIVGGVFTDAFANGNTVHIYRIDA